MKNKVLLTTLFLLVITLLGCTELNQLNQNTESDNNNTVEINLFEKYESNNPFKVDQEYLSYCESLSTPDKQYACKTNSAKGPQYCEFTNAQKEKENCILSSIKNSNFVLLGDERYTNFHYYWYLKYLEDVEDVQSKQKFYQEFMICDYIDNNGQKDTCLTWLFNKNQAFVPYDDDPNFIEARQVFVENYIKKNN
ncbi:MAG: hypothetical protein WC308_00615 [archaeon]